MKCPRCSVDLVAHYQHGIEIDICSGCNGRWLGHDELEALEATVPSTPEQRRATIQYSRRQSEFLCPVCSKQMVSFNYRAYSLELDACEDDHGYWLDAGEDGKIRDIIEDRVRGLERAASAEQSWGRFLSGLKGRGGRSGRR